MQKRQSDYRLCNYVLASSWHTSWEFQQLLWGSEGFGHKLLTWSHQSFPWQLIPNSLLRESTLVFEVHCLKKVINSAEGLCSIEQYNHDYILIEILIHLRACVKLKAMALYMVNERLKTFENCKWPFTDKAPCSVQKVQLVLCSLLWCLIA